MMTEPKIDRYDCGEMTILINPFNGVSSRQTLDNQVKVVCSRRESGSDYEEVLIICFAICLN